MWHDFGKDQMTESVVNVMHFLLQVVYGIS